MPLSVDSLNSGTIKTESLTVAGEPVGPKYKVYTALLTQTGTDAPIATVLENTIGNIVWTRENIGNYYATLNNTFTLNKTWGLVTNRFSDDGGPTAYDAFLFTATDINFIVLKTFNNGDASDNLIANDSPLSIEIRVYI